MRYPCITVVPHSNIVKIFFSSINDFVNFRIHFLIIIWLVLFEIYYVNSLLVFLSSCKVWSQNDRKESRLTSAVEIFLFFYNNCDWQQLHFLDMHFNY